MNDERKEKSVFPSNKEFCHFSDYEYTCALQTDADSTDTVDTDFHEYDYWEKNTKNLWNETEKKKWKYLAVNGVINAEI